jgi:2'-5' RNA ligase
VRLFLAINLPGEERERLSNETAPLRAAGLPVRWVPPANLHLTLRFLGSVEASLVQPIMEAAARAVDGLEAFDVPISGVGAFPGPHRPRVLWIGAKDVPPLRRLHAALEEALAPLGFAPGGRAFQPHVTLGRVHARARPRELAPFADLASRIRYRGVLPVRAVDLMRSELAPGGARYERIGGMPLG